MNRPTAAKRRKGRKGEFQIPGGIVDGWAGSLLAVLVGVTILAGCATKPVPESRRQQVEQITDTGPYSYQRALGGPPR